MFKKIKFNFYFTYLLCFQISHQNSDKIQGRRNQIFLGNPHKINMSNIGKPGEMLLQFFCFSLLALLRFISFDKLSTNIQNKSTKSTQEAETYHRSYR